jgi:hypothetical protein
VNLLKQQIDFLKHEKEDAINRQIELDIILGNFRSAENAPHPEFDRIKKLKNKLDKAGIKNGETKNLMRIYSGVIRQFDRQEMHWNPLVLEQQAEIHKKHRDISELSLIARDSKHSKSIAKTDFTETKKRCADAQKKRQRELKSKKKLLIDLGSMQVLESDTRTARPQRSISARGSQMRNKMNKQAREKREERYRQVLGVYEKIHDSFGTNDPGAIAKVFTERRDTSNTLNKQIEDLKQVNQKLGHEIDSMNVAIDEMEFTMAKGVGSQRMTAEGSKILTETQKKLQRNERKMEAFHSHQKDVLAGVAHLVDILGLVTVEDEDLPLTFAGLVEWVMGRMEKVQIVIDAEDESMIPLVNPVVYQSYVNRNGPPVEVETKKPPKRGEGGRRAREQKGDIQTRVLDRAAVKAAALKAVTLAHQVKKPVHK